MDDESKTSPSPNLGRLERVDLRTSWQTEAGDFTPWLAQDANLSLLGNTIGIELELEGTEKAVGDFSADILCKDTSKRDWVLIENQLERTDHTHLGQILTYASGLSAVTIVWIAAPFREEHRAALDWLNEITEDRFNFFGLEIELWKIGDSLAAPKFNIVSAPNNWTRSVSRAAKAIANEELTELRQLQQQFWKAFNELLAERQGRIKPRQEAPQNWLLYSLGRSNFGLYATFNVWEKTSSVHLAITGEHAKPHFYLLERDKTAIEAEFGEALEWRELPEAKESQVRLYLRDIDPQEPENWPQIHEWMARNLERLDAVFRDRIRKLNADDWESHE
jgi:hypothetical protein